MSLLLDEFGWLKHASQNANLMINKALATSWKWGAFQKNDVSTDSKRNSTP